jgi:serine/threonine protein kinase
MKSQNILLNYKPDDNIPVLVVKITDFGLSMMKNNTDTSYRGAYKLYNVRIT